MNRALMSINCCGFMCQNVRESFQDAASRWGAEYVEVTEATVREDLHCHPAGKKANMFHQCPDADEVMVIDADAIISKICPSPFEFRESESLMAVRNGQPWFGDFGAILACQIYEWGKICDRYGRIPMGANYFNSGMIVANRKLHYDFLEEARTMVQIDLGLGWIDQTPLNYAVLKHNVKVQIVDETWNFIHSEHIPNFMNMLATGKYIYHFAGTCGREKILTEINWKS